MRFFPQVGVDPVAALDGPMFFRLAERIGVYGGVVAFRATQQSETQDRQPRPITSPQTETARKLNSGAREVPLAAIMQNHGDLLEVRTVSG